MAALEISCWNQRGRWIVLSCTGFTGKEGGLVAVRQIVPRAVEGCVRWGRCPQVFTISLATGCGIIFNHS